MNRIKRHFYNKWEWDSNEKIISNFRNWLAYFLFQKKSKVLTIDQTFDYILSHSSSVARYGDGEFKCAWGGGNVFQSTDLLLSNRLREILKDNSNEDCLICIPNIDELLKDFNEDNFCFWKKFIRQNGKKIVGMIKPSKRMFGASHFTRFYFGIKNKAAAKQYVEKIKAIWDNQDLLIVEGAFSKLGIGSDLFSNARSIKRIIAPAENSFSKYDEILQTVLSNHQGELVLIALGPTATVLAYDLSKAGIRALDVGHIDIEYMWFKMGATERTKIPGKHTAEVLDDESVYSSKNDAEYQNSIIKHIS